jgi:hypothetical protein
MKFTITYADGTTEDREMSDCSTVDAALNAIAGSTPGVQVSAAGQTTLVSPEPTPIA